MADLQAVLTKLNERILKLEGELFVLRSIARGTLAHEDEGGARMRKLIEGAKLVLEDETRRPLDSPTRTYIQAAIALVDELLETPREPGSLFRVIEGGRKDD